MRVLLAIGIAALGFASAAYADGLQVSPIMINMAPEHPIAAFTLHNGRDQETAFEVSAFDWTQEDGRTVLTPTHDIVVAPSVFLAPAGGDQIVRLGVVVPTEGATERSYRLVVRELPNPEAPQQTGFRLVIEMSMPVFVTPAGARGSLQARRTHGSDGEPAMVMTNNGAAHVQLSAAPGARGVEDMPRYLLAGAQFERPLAPGDHDVSVQVARAGDSAAHTQTFELSDAPVVADLH